MIGLAEATADLMLKELLIKNFSIIEITEVRFREGFHVLSGETGAGKSFLVQAIGFALGARSDSESIRAGAKEASVSATFTLEATPRLSELLLELGIDSYEEDGHLLLRRTLNEAGRSRGFINDQAVTLKALQRVGSCLVHQVGQQAARQLLEENFLFFLLDQFGGHQQTVQAYQAALSLYQEVGAKLASLKARIQKSQEQEDFFRFQYEELKNAQLRTGEEEELESQKQRLKHRVALANQTFEMNQLLVESEGAVVDQLAKAQSLGEKSRVLDESLAELVTLVAEAAEKIESVGEQLRDYVQGLQEDSGSFDEVEGRLAQIHELKRKYKLSESELVDKQQQLSEQLHELEDFATLLEGSEGDVEQALQDLKGVAKKLRKLREQAGQKIIGKLKKNLQDLALPNAKLKWEFVPFENPQQFRSWGSESLSLFVSFNPGEELRPFQDVISGGELSRLLLAIYEVLYPPKMFGTFILDEVDAGVSGGVADLIGRKLKTLSQETQVLCITHLPQIASQASSHYAIEKQVRKGRTYSQIRLLESGERIHEIARMLAGVDVTEQALKHAKELLSNHAA